MTDREYVPLALAQEAVVDGPGQLDQHISPRVLAGTIEDAGVLDGSRDSRLRAGPR